MTRRIASPLLAGTALPRHALAWTDRLVAELDRRVARHVRVWREASADPALKSLVITEAEVDELLSRPQARAPELPADEPGSLAAALQADGDARVRALRSRFDLSPLELDALLVGLAPEIERRFERLFAYLNDDMSRQRPDAALLLRLVAPRGRHVALQAPLLADARLRRCGLLVADDGARSTAEALRVADGVVRFLLQRDGADLALSTALLGDDAAPLAPLLWRQRREDAALAALFEQAATRASAVVLNVHGRAGSGRGFLVRDACANAGIGCLALDARKLRRAGPTALPAALRAALRDTQLAGHALFIHHADALADDADAQAELRGQLQSWLAEFGGLVVLGTRESLPLDGWFPAAEVATLALPQPDIGERQRAWETALAAVAPFDAARQQALAQALAVKFRITHGDIATALAQTRRLSQADPLDDAAWAAALHGVVARVAAPRLHELAEAMPTVHRLSDLVLPPDRIEVLHDLVRRVRHRRRVLEDWHFDAVSPRGHGLVALFHGASGTGKTMAADAIAHTLDMQLFRIDLAGVVSKYIGETEKNLRTIFDEADRADAVLFFDEADALFGKRSEVKDAHDRYANIEINYLLQRIESFDGIAVLATNRHSHIDEAFARRIHVTLEFPLPREAERARLWDRSFPAAAPLADDIDWAFLARSFELTGGAIRNAALSSAYLAADADANGEIGMRDVVNALRTELVKAGRRIQDSEFGPYAALLARAPSTSAPFSPRARRATAAFKED